MVVMFTLLSSFQEKYKLCLDALDQGLCMDELPLSSTDCNEVRSVIQKLLTAKAFNNADALRNATVAEPGSEIFP